MNRAALEEATTKAMAHLMAAGTYYLHGKQSAAEEELRLAEEQTKKVREIIETPRGELVT